MSPSICVSPWRRKPGKPRYYITDGREPLGALYERRGIFSGITSDGNLVAAISSLRNAVDALIAGASS